MKGFISVVFILTMTLAATGCSTRQPVNQGPTQPSPADKAPATPSTSTTPASTTVPQEAHGVTDPPPDGTELPPAQPTIGPAVPKGVADLLEKNLKAYLNPFLSADQPDWNRLKEWRLESITGQGEGYFTYYAVLPSVRKSNWWAGSGIAGKDGWILHKDIPVQVAMHNGVYEVVPGGGP